MSGIDRLMILSAGAGAGHNRAGRALERVCNCNSRIGEVKFIDCLEHTNPAFKALYSKYYLEAVNNTPTLYGWAFRQTDVPWRNYVLLEKFELLNAGKLIDLIVEYHPDACVCTHFMPSVVLSHLIRKKRIDTNLSVIVTDFYPHSVWLTQLFHQYFVPTEECKLELVDAEIPADRIHVTGIPIDPVFNEEKDRLELCEKHDIDPDKPTILLSAGAVGIMSYNDIVGFLKAIHTDCQIVVICGTNEKLRSRMEQFVEESGETERFRILGFTEEMDEWMTMADLYIGKPGGLTTSECLSKHLPMIICDPYPGQEMHNTVVLLENGTAVIPSSVSTIGYKVDQVLGDADRLESMKRASARLAKPRAADSIVQNIIESTGTGIHAVPLKRLSDLTRSDKRDEEPPDGKKMLLPG
jgi:processive 1,2-diacylglycerol beta-glucosyltransferase